METITGNATASGPNSAETVINVTGPDGSTCGQGTKQCSFNYTPSSDECGETLTFTATAEDCGDAAADVFVRCNTDSSAPASVDLTEEPPVIGGNPPGQDLGRVTFDKVPEIETELFCDGPTQVWTRRIISATFRLKKEVLNAETQLTDELLKYLKCDTLMALGPVIFKLTTDVGSASSHIPKDLIQAHEDVHVAIIGENLSQLYVSLKVKIDRITVPCDNYTFEEALEATKLATKKAEKWFLEQVVDCDTANAAHEQKARFLAAQSPIAYSWYNKLRAAQSLNKCPDQLPDIGH